MQFHTSPCASRSVRPSALHCSCDVLPLNTNDASNCSGCKLNTCTQAVDVLTTAARKRASDETLISLIGAASGQTKAACCKPEATSHTLMLPSPAPMISSVSSLDHTMQQGALRTCSETSAVYDNVLQMQILLLLILADAQATIAELGLKLVLVTTSVWWA